MKDYIEEMMKTAGVEPNITYFEAVNPWAEISSGKLVTAGCRFCVGCPSKEDEFLFTTYIKQWLQIESGE